MKKFRTELKVTPSPSLIHLKSAIFTQGSCFADAIGERLVSHKLRVCTNPFGVVYNPESIHKVLRYGIFNEPVPRHTYIRKEELYVNYDFHSEFAALSEGALADRLMNIIGTTHYFLKDCDWLLLTYGTAWVYKRNETGEVVANCHKLPSATFTKHLLTAEAIVSSFTEFFRHLRRLNAKVRIILTVSPVRHLKDTHELNSVSKAVLRLACHQLTNQYEDVEYFPAYEMMIDDLRDYRFYKPDMLHPTTEAEDYIWEKFMERYFSTELKDFVQHWKTILAAISHKPFYPKTEAHQQFLRETLKKLEDLRTTVDVEDEISLVKQQITN